jgi:hypothetical protein
MPTDVPGNQPPARPVRPAGPIISACYGKVCITGTGFLPNCPVTVRITCSSDDIVDYLTDISDADGGLSAPLPETAVTETGTSPSPTTAPVPLVTEACCGVTPSSLPLPVREILHGRHGRPQMVGNPDREPFRVGPLSGPHPCPSKPHWCAMELAFLLAGHSSR